MASLVCMWKTVDEKPQLVEEAKILVRRFDRALRLMEEPDVGMALGGRGLVKQEALDKVKDAMRGPLELAMLHKWIIVDDG